MTRALVVGAIGAWGCARVGDVNPIEEAIEPEVAARHGASPAPYQTPVPDADPDPDFDPDSDSDPDPSFGDANESCAHVDWTPRPNPELSRTKALATCRAVLGRMRGASCADGWCACQERCFTASFVPRVPTPAGCGCFGDETLDAVCEHMYEGGQIGQTSRRPLRRCLAALTQTRGETSPECSIGGLIDSFVERYPNGIGDRYGAPDPSVPVFECEPCEHLGVVRACATDPDHCPLLTFALASERPPQGPEPAVDVHVTARGRWKDDLAELREHGRWTVMDCYRAALDGTPGLSGTVTVRAACQPAAAVLDIDPRLAATGIEACLSRHMAKWVDDDDCDSTAVMTASFELRPERQRPGACPLSLPASP